MTRKLFKVYTVRVRVPRFGDEPDRGLWLEIGIASENRDGTISAKLDALPVNGTVQLKEWTPCTKKTK